MGKGKRWNRDSENMARLVESEIRRRVGTALRRGRQGGMEVGLALKAEDNSRSKYEFFFLVFLGGRPHIL